ncbi:MAG: AMP-binding protein [Deltaproteobacteria bacterium]
MAQNLFQVFEENCRVHPARTAIKLKKHDGYESVTYAGLLERTRALCRVFARRGIRPGDRVAILMNNGPDWAAAFFAAMALQAVAVPLDAQTAPQDVAAVLAHARVRLLVTQERFGVALSEILGGVAVDVPFFVDLPWEEEAGSPATGLRNGRPAPGPAGEFGPHKLAALFYTSGTTSTHKAVMLTHANLLANCESVRRLRLVRPDDVILSVLPLHHTYPFMVTFLVPLLEGAGVIYLQSLMHHELFAALHENRVTVFVAVPQLYTLIARSIAEKIDNLGGFVRWTVDRAMDTCAFVSRTTGRNVAKTVLRRLHATMGGHLRFMVSGGAKLDPEVARAFYRWGLPIVEGYGLTETAPVVTFNSMNPRKYATVGRVLSGIRVRIEAPNDEGVGEICVRGDNVMLGYYRAPAMTRAVLRDGWFFTGDLGRIDKGGFLVLAGRKNELIVLPSGKKVNPEEVEAHYGACPYIKELCVLSGGAGADAGHLVAVIVPDEDLLRAHKYLDIGFKIRWELDSYSQRLPVYKRVRGFVLTPESLPRTRLGKLIRYQIAARYAAGSYAENIRQRKEEAVTPFEDMALRYLSRILGREVHIGDHLELDLGLDSLGRIELLSSLQDLINVGIDDSLALELFNARTVRELVGKARQALPESAFEGVVKREETVFWSQLLRELPRPASLERIKLEFDRYDRAIAYLMAWSFKFLMRVFFLVRVRNKERVPKKGPFVVVSNHVSFLDPFYLLCAMSARTIVDTYFVGFGAIFSKPLIAWAVRFCRLVPIDINLDMAETLRVCRYLLAKGKIVVYFPEGQRSGDGKVKEFRKGVGILLREAGCHAVPFYLEGAFKVWPRSRPLPLPGRVTVHVGSPVEPEALGLGISGDPYAAVAKGLEKRVAELEADPD